MAQDWTDDVYAGGHVVQTDMQNIEDNLACLKTSFSGGSAPASPSPGQFWFDTSANILKLRNEADSGWLNVWDIANDKPYGQDFTSGSYLDGDKIDIDFTPTNYTPDASPAEADDVDDLTAHLKGIDTAIGNPEVADGSITGAKLEDLEASDEATLITNTTLRSVQNVSWVKLKEITIYRGGALHIAWEQRAATPYSCEAKVYRNGSPVGTLKSTSSVSFVDMSDEISGWSYGDLVQIYGRGTTAPAYCYIQNMAIKSSNKLINFAENNESY